MIVTVKRTWWNEPLRMAILGALSIAAVIGMRLLFLGKSGDHPTPGAQSISEIDRKIEELGDREKAMSRRLGELESAVQDLEKRVKSTDAQGSGSKPDELPVAGSSTPTPPTAVAVGSAPTAEGTLKRGWAYIAKGEFDPNGHNQLLSELVAAYALPGLSKELNASLITTIQQVNEIGTNRVIGELPVLSELDAAQRIRTFLDTTPKLTPRQKQRLKAARAMHSF